MNLYVSNLMSQVTDQDLMKLFSTYGQVSSVKVITDRNTGVSRGFGFVVMPQQTEADKAIDVFHMRKSGAKLTDSDQLALTEHLERAIRDSA